MFKFKNFLKYATEKDLIELNIFLDPIIISLIFFILFNNLIQDIKILFSYIFSLAIIVHYLFSKFGLYNNFRYKSLYNLANKIFSSWIFTFSIFLTINIFINEEYYFDNLRFIYWFIITGIYLFISHFLLRKILRKCLVKGFNTKKVIFYGNIEDIKNFQSIIDKNKWMGDQIVGVFGDNQKLKVENRNIKNYLGGIKEMNVFLQKNDVNMIYFSHNNSYSTSIDELLDIFGNTSLPVIYIPGWTTGGMILKPFEIGNDKLALEIWGNERSYINLFKKRIFDLVISLFLIILLIPFLIIIGIFVKLNSKGPILFKQYRSGLNGKKFLIYKFRTLYFDQCNDNLTQVKANDKRVTSFGRLIRKWSIDELPQLFNVFKGDMSLVGPRPHAIEHNQIYRKIIRGYMQRHASIPGLTGLAQIQGLRGETSDITKMESRIIADLKYHSQWSMFLDVKILIKTLINIKSETEF